MAVTKLLGCAAPPCKGRRGVSKPSALSPARGAPAATKCGAAAPLPQEQGVDLVVGTPPVASAETPVTAEHAEREANPQERHASEPEHPHARAGSRRGTPLAEAMRAGRRSFTALSGAAGLTFAAAARAAHLAARLRGSARRRKEAEEEGADADAGVRALLGLLEPGRPLAGLSSFAKEYGDAAFARRLLRKFDGDVRRCERKFEEALRWREAHEELITTRRFAPAGDNRVLGLDLAGRPILYTCMKNQMLSGSQGLDMMTARTLEAIDVMPPGVEKATHVWDVHGLMVRLNLSPAPLAHMIASMEGYFAERVHQVVIIDMPGVARFLKDAVWPLVPARTKEKIVFLTAEQAHARFRAECDGEVADRIIGAMEQNRDRRLTLEERRRTWVKLDKNGALVPALP